MQRRFGLFEQAEKEVFGADVIVVELSGLAGGGIECLFQGRAEEQVGGRGALDFGFAVYFALDGGGEDGRGEAKLLQESGDEAVLLLEQSGQEVDGVHFLIGIALGGLLGLLESFLGFDGEAIRRHSKKRFRGSLEIHSGHLDISGQAAGAKGWEGDREESDLDFLFQNGKQTNSSTANCKSV